MELNSNTTIHFANVANNETFTFPLIVVKGCIFDDNDENLEDNITVRYVDSDGNITKEVHSRLLDEKFSLLLDLKPRDNDFVFKYKTAESRITFHHNLPLSKFVVSPVYIICDGEKPRHSIKTISDKIFVGCSLLQTLIAETLYQCGFERKTFALEQDHVNRNRGCLIFYSKLNMSRAAKMTSEELWEYFGREIMTSEHGYQHRKFLSFLSYGKSRFPQNLAIGGGGLALCSAEYIDTWPESIDEINRCFVDEMLTGIHTNNINRIYGNSFSASLGAVCHELCHTFDLGHTTDGIMGRDFDRVGVIFSLFKSDAVRQETEKMQNFNCIRSKKDSLIICEGICRRKLNINYSVNSNNLSQSFTRNLLPKKCDFKIENTTYREKSNINDIFPHILFWSDGCATILVHHKWINQCFLKNKNNNANTENEISYDAVRNIVTSKFGIVVVQLRNQNGYVLKSWEFPERRRKTLFLVPNCESRKADLIVIEDSKGNLIKKDIEHFLNDSTKT